jgi:hypothetical protein
VVVNKFDLLSEDAAIKLVFKHSCIDNLHGVDLGIAVQENDPRIVPHHA